MAGSFTPYKYWRRLIACFFVGAIPFLIAVLTAPSSSVLGIFLSGLLVALGTTGYGFLLFTCIVVAGLLGVALGLLISYIIKSFKNRSKNLIQTNEFLKGNNMDEKSQWDIQQNPTEEKSIELMQQQVLGADKSNVDDIDNLLNWGEEIRKSLYTQVFNQEDEKVVKNSLIENSQKLTERYKELALRYHPDKERNLSQKASKEEIFKKLANAYDTIKECWRLALEGRDKTILSVLSEPYQAAEDTDNGTEINILLSKQNELLREQIQLRKEYLEKLKKVYEGIAQESDLIIKNFFTEERREQTKNELRADLKKEFPHLWQNEDVNNEEPQQNSSEFSSYMGKLGTYMGAFFSSISNSVSQTWNQTCNNSKEEQEEEKEQLSPPPPQTSFSCTPCNRCDESEN